MKTMVAGGEVDTMCTRCKLELAHVIVAMVGQRIVRVQCKTCHTVHAFHGGQQRSSSPRPRLERPVAPRTPPAASEYDRLLHGHDLSRAKPYRASTEYGLHEVINHVKFGLGLVTRVLPDQKIEVAFPSGGRVLVHARSA